MTDANEERGHGRERPPMPEAARETIRRYLREARKTHRQRAAERARRQSPPGKYEVTPDMAPGPRRHDRKAWVFLPRRRADGHYGSNQ